MTAIERSSPVQIPHHQLGIWTIPIVSVLVLLLSLPALSHAFQTASLAWGVVVEQVEKGSEAEKAGLQAGDVILSWSRSDSHGNIESPFDLAEVEIEQNPRGSVLLEGLRGREKQAWRMGPNAWGIGRRPILSGDFLTAYQQSQELAKAGALAEAAERLRTVNSRVQKSDPSWLGPWFLSRAAEWSSKAQQSKETDEAYGEAVLQATDGQPQVAALLLRSWGNILHARSEWDKAEDCYRKSITESRKLVMTSLMVAGSFNNLGLVAADRGDFAKAEENCRQALEIRESLAPGSLDVAGSLNNLGDAFWNRGDLDKAEDYFRQSLVIREKLVPGSLDVAASILNLGLVATSRGDLPRAEELFNQALAIREKLVPGSLDVAGSLNNLGVVAWNRGDLAGAEGYYRRALVLKEKLDPGSLDVSKTLNNLGIVAWSRGDLARAEEYYRQALAIRERLAFGSLDVAASLLNLGVVATNQGDLARAEEYYRQALAIQEKIAPGSHDVAASLANLGENAEVVEVENAHNT